MRLKSDASSSLQGHLKVILNQTHTHLSPVEDVMRQFTDRNKPVASHFLFHHGGNWVLRTVDPMSHVVGTDPTVFLAWGAGSSPEEAFESWRKHAEWRVPSWIADYTRRLRLLDDCMDVREGMRETGDVTDLRERYRAQLWNLIRSAPLQPEDE